MLIFLVDRVLHGHNSCRFFHQFCFEKIVEFFGLVKFGALANLTELCMVEFFSSFQKYQRTVLFGFSGGRGTHFNLKKATCHFGSWIANDHFLDCQKKSDLFFSRFQRYLKNR
jgi:hypothetical protein